MNVNKPRGWTSHDVVARVRRLADQKRVGHAGTLDPMAEGVLPVLLGRATRLADFIHAGHKTYRAVVCLGTATDTDDAEGEVVAASDVPTLSAARVSDVLGAFEGEILQTPPRYSALKVGGRRAYAVARAGGDLNLAPRPVSIHAIRLLNLAEGQLTLDVTCSKGTYIRALARDVAAALGTIGHLGALTRTRVGPFSLDESITLEELAERGAEALTLPASRAIPAAPTFSADQDQIARLANGQAVAADGLHAEAIWVYDPDGRVICLGSSDGMHLRPRLLL